MDKKHVQLIRCNYDELVDVTTRIDDIILFLEKRRILNQNMVKFLLLSDERRKRLKNFYEMIQGRGPRAFECLLQSLRETENFRAEKILNKDNLKTYESSPPLESQMLISGSPEDVADGKDELIVKIHPESKFMDNDEENPPNGTYIMRSKPRGHALIINIYKTVDGEERRGSELDYRKLQKLFKDLGYKVESHRDLRLKEMQDVITAFASNPALANVDSTAVFIMCHGIQSSPGDKTVNLIAYDRKHLNTKWIIDQFFSPSVKLITKPGERKPKLFFFQACRCPEDELYPQLNIRYTVEPDSELISGPTNTSNRRHEDAFIMFSTVCGYPSLRDPTNGAWFVDKFCEIVAANAWQYDLDTMMGMVDAEIRNLSSPLFGGQTSELTKQGASKKVFFNPGL